MLHHRLHSDTFRDDHRSRPQDFTRRSPLSFTHVFTIIGKMILGSIQRELDDFFKELFGRRVSHKEVTAAAFSKARKKFKHSAFVELNRETVDHTYANSSQLEDFVGMRLMAIDGSKVNLPESEDNRTQFGPLVKKPGQEGPPLALVSQCYDVQNGIIVDARIASASIGERELALQHLEFVGEDDLLLMDRGYQGYCFFRSILDTGAGFCCRSTLTSCKAVEVFVASGKEQDIITLVPTAEAIKECQQLKLDTSPLLVRAVRVELSSGETEVLLTSLVDEQLSTELFGDLYAMRWGCEEGYKHQKSAAEMENFSGRSAEAVRQDFYARVFIVNLTAILALPVHEQVKERTAHRQLDYEVNWTSALSKVRNCGIQLFLGDDIEDLITKLQWAIGEGLTERRPGRSYPRKNTPTKHRFVMNRKRI